VKLRDHRLGIWGGVSSVLGSNIGYTGFMAGIGYRY
jgi:hypothetical protein